MNKNRRNLTLTSPGSYHRQSRNTEYDINLILISLIEVYYCIDFITILSQFFQRRQKL